MKTGGNVATPHLAGKAEFCERELTLSVVSYAQKKEPGKRRPPVQNPS
ncbi:MAG TPA: hypothetical protein VF437_07305 [Verrucomicrobiae bacterium]